MERAVAQAQRVPRTRRRARSRLRPARRAPSRRHRSRTVAAACPRPAADLGRRLCRDSTAIRWLALTAVSSRRCSPMPRAGSTRGRRTSAQAPTPGPRPAPARTPSGRGPPGADPTGSAVASSPTATSLSRWKAASLREMPVAARCLLTSHRARLPRGPRRTSRRRAGSSSAASTAIWSAICVTPRRLSRRSALTPVTIIRLIFISEKP